MQTKIRCLLVKLPVIRYFLRRQRWQNQFDDDVTIVPIYNTGRNLLLGTLHGTAITHYEPTCTWSWIKYLDFCEPKYILANKNFFDTKVTKLDMIGFQHLGHDETGVARVLTVNGPRSSLPHHIKIGSKCILFLAVKNGIILSRLQIYQPLPFTIRSWDDCLRWVKRYTFNPKQINGMKINNIF